MPTFRKKPVEIQAELQHEPFSVKTLEGTMNGKAGDWLLVGVSGERYPCDAAIFEKTYEPVDGPAQVMWTERYKPDQG